MQMKFFVKGALGLFILSEAKEKEVSGKEISEKLDKLSGGMWKPSPGSIYPMLRQMEKRKCIKAKISSEQGRREIKYSLTGKGAQELKKGKEIVVKLDDIGQVFMPILMKVMYGLSDKEVEEIQQDMKGLYVWRAKLISLPANERKKAILRVVKLLEKDVLVGVK